MEARLDEQALELRKEKKKQRQKELNQRKKGIPLVDLEHAAIRFYKSFDNLPPHISIDKELLSYTKAIYAHHKRPEPNINLTEAENAPPTTALNPNNALITFSGGTDSAASIIWALNQGYQVYLLHLYCLNKTTAGMELPAVQNIAKTLGLENKLVILKHPLNKRKTENTEKKDFLENPAKNQYLYLLALDYMKRFNCGKIIASGQEGVAPYFSDMKEAYELFYPFARSLIGDHECIFPFQKKDSYVFTLLQAARLQGQESLLFQVSSCFRARMAGEDTGCSILPLPSEPVKNDLDKIAIETKAAYVRVRNKLFYIDKTKSAKQCLEIAVSNETLTSLDLDLQFNPLNSPRKLSYAERIKIHQKTGHTSNTNECGACSKCKTMARLRTQFAKDFTAPLDEVLTIGPSTPQNDPRQVEKPTSSWTPTLFELPGKRKLAEEDSYKNEQDAKRSRLEEDEKVMPKH